jgi:hypothetical protein
VFDLGYSPEYARRLSDRVVENATKVFDILEKRECERALKSAYFSVFNTVYGILIDHLIMGVDIATKIVEYERMLDRKIEAIREKYPELPPKVRREVERLEKMKITKMLDKSPYEITLGDLLSLFKTLAGKLTMMCIREWRRRTGRGSSSSKSGEVEERGEEEVEEVKIAEE